MGVRVIINDDSVVIYCDVVKYFVNNVSYRVVNIFRIMGCDDIKVVYE